MSHFKQITNLPILDLHSELTKMLANGIVDFSSFNQISLNTIPSQPDNFKIGTGSLLYDWNNSKEITNLDGTTTVVPTNHEVSLREEDFSVLCTQFKNTVFEEIYSELSKKYKLGRVRIMKMGLRYCMSWHTDTSRRLHFPIKTQDGCFMIIENEIKHIPQNEWWMTDTTKNHTALNASNEERLHLVAAILS
jgi:hypothetical protein